jgi:hypothetical protein
MKWYWFVVIYSLVCFIYGLRCFVIKLDKPIPDYYDVPVKTETNIIYQVKIHE